MNFINMAASLLGGKGEGIAGTLINGLISHFTNRMKSGGGFNGIIDQFKQCGMGDQAQSWVGNGANQPISGQQILQFMPEPLKQLAKTCNVDLNQICDCAAKLVPEMINQMTPNGQPPSNPQDAEQILRGFGAGAGAGGAGAGAGNTNASNF